MGILKESLKYRYIIMANGNIPPGEYQSVLMEIRKEKNEAKTDDTDDWEVIDLCYELINEKDEVFYIRERYKEKNQRWMELISLLTTYGFGPNTDDEELIGLKEWVNVVYRGQLGRLECRFPIAMVDITEKGYQIEYEKEEE